MSDTDKNITTQLTQQPEIPIRLRGREIPVRYYTAGDSQKNDKPAILFVHGLRDSAFYFERIAGCFAERGYRGFSLELPGYDADAWGASVQLDEYTIPTFAAYLQAAIEALGTQHRLERHEWAVWGHSMGGAIVYRAMAENPAMFRQLRHIILEAPAFADRLTFGSRIGLWLSEPLSKSAPGRYVGRKLIEGYIARQGVAFDKLTEIEGFIDSHAIFQQVTTSLKDPANTFDAEILQTVGDARLLWIWSIIDPAVKAKPLEVIPVEQQLRFKAGHNVSLVAPEAVCQKVEQRFAYDCRPSF
jgi:pimeloyl-ACP methyl ester carboxylesterase